MPAMVIRTPDHRLRVFVSSTLKELAEERKAVRAAILKLRLSPVMFESGARPHPPQELYRSYLAQSQIFIGIYWQSYGWVAPGMSISGLEDEYQLSTGMPSLIYVKKPAPDREPALRAFLDRIREQSSGSYAYFSTIEELEDLVENDLAVLLTERFETVGQAEPRLADSMMLPPSNVPTPRNHLVDRVEEFAAAQQLLLADEVALLTITGAGGTGKSRLAIEVGLALREHFDDGAYMVGLEPITDPGRVVSVIAEVLGIREAAGGRPVGDILKESLRAKRALLLLDNFEQVVAAAPALADILEACPRLKILVTSRTPLRLRAERVMPLAPLPVPPPKVPDDPARLRDYASVELFVQRAQANRPDFAITRENAVALTEICDRLDGLPLALELAAARINLLSPAELSDRLSHRFDLLRGGTRDLPERQQTLRGAIDWSYRLIGEMEKRLLRRAAVFASGWTLEAARVVCDLDGTLAPQLEEALASLIDSSMVITLVGEAATVSRFGMLSTIHEFASEQLMESGEWDEVHCQHAQYCLDFVREAEPRLRSVERSRWQAILPAEFQNIRATLEWIYSTRQCISVGQEITIGLGFAWHFCGYLAEGEEWCHRFLKVSDEATPALVRAGLLCWAGELAWARGNQESAIAQLEQSLALLSDQHDRGLLAHALLMRGMCALSARDLVRARTMFERCIELYREIGDLWYEAVSVSWLGDLAAYEDDGERARVLHERSMELAEAQGDPWCRIPALMSMGQQAVVDGDLERAEPLCLEAERILRDVGDRWSLCWALNDLAFLAIMNDELTLAGKYLREGLEIGHALGNLRSVVVALAAAAAVIAGRSREGQAGADITLAPRLCGATLAYVHQADLFIWPDTKTIYDGATHKVLSIIDIESWKRGFAEGRRLALDQAVDLALEALTV
jgi:predicted ATPase